MFVLCNVMAVTECSPHVPCVGIVIKVYIENNGQMAVVHVLLN